MELQNLLNPARKGKPQIQSAARVFRVGDKVMQVRNNYEITWQRIGGEQGVGAYNGDIGDCGVHQPSGPLHGGADGRPTPCLPGGEPQ